MPAAVLLLAVLACPAGALAAGSLALFPFELIDSSPEPVRPEEATRLQALAPETAHMLRDKGGYQIVDTAPVAAEVERLAPLRDCNGCELDLARQLGADLVGLGWVQKVSNLILNINLQIREVATGKLVRAGSVDIRGNTDESWQRGLRYLLANRILKQ
jgi:hypothetical protein